MGEFGALASRYYANVHSLEEFDEALESLQGRENLSPERSKDEFRKLLAVLEPVRNAISRKLSESMVVDDLDLVDILRQRHLSEWQNYSSDVIELAEKLSNSSAIIHEHDWAVLNDVADALDAQCSQLLKRISGRS